MDNLGEDIKLLIVGYLTKELNQQDISLLMQWVNANEENRRYYNRIKASWELAGMQKEVDKYNVADSWKSAQPVINKSNGQINFSIKKTSLPKEIKDKLPKLKRIKIDWEDFEF